MHICTSSVVQFVLNFDMRLLSWSCNIQLDKRSTKTRSNLWLNQSSWHSYIFVYNSTQRNDFLAFCHLISLSTLASTLRSWFWSALILFVTRIPLLWRSYSSGVFCHRLCLSVNNWRYAPSCCTDLWLLFSFNTYLFLRLFAYGLCLCFRDWIYNLSVAILIV